MGKERLPGREGHRRHPHEWHYHSVTHTNWAANPWWRSPRVSKIQTFQEIEVWRRADCCKEHYENLEVWVGFDGETYNGDGNVQCGERISAAQSKNLNAEPNQRHGKYAGAYTFPCENAEGVYVWVVRVVNRGVLMIGEVVARGQNEQIINLASSDSMSDTLTKEFAIAKPHSQVQLTFSLLAIDNWSGESIILTVDGAEVWRKAYSPATDGSHICGAPNKKDIHDQDIQVIVEHTSDTLLAQFSTTSLKSKKDAPWALTGFELKESERGEKPPRISSFWSGQTLQGYFDGGFAGYEPIESTCENLIHWGGHSHVGAIIGGIGKLGPGSSILRDYEVEKSHSLVRVSLDFVALDNWNNEDFIVEINDVEVWRESVGTDGWEGGDLLCGAWTSHEVSYDTIRHVEAVVSQTSPMVRVRVRTTLLPDNTLAFWGIANVTIQSMKDTTCLAETLQIQEDGFSCGQNISYLPRSREPSIQRCDLSLPCHLQGQNCENGGKLYTCAEKDTATCGKIMSQTLNKETYVAAFRRDDFQIGWNISGIRNGKPPSILIDWVEMYD
jgi:hypothetical protein